MKNTYSGQTLIEIIITVALVILLSTGLLAATMSTISISRQARNRSVATKLVEEAFEIVRSKRDQGWNNFKSTFNVSPNIFCLDGNGNFAQKTVGYNCTAITANNQQFIRTALFTWDNGAMSGIPKFVVEVRVEWQEGSKTKSTYASSYFTQWK